jgi:hypothetical protein
MTGRSAGTRQGVICVGRRELFLGLEEDGVAVLERRGEVDG